MFKDANGRIDEDKVTQLQSAALSSNMDESMRNAVHLFWVDVSALCEKAKQGDEKGQGEIMFFTMPLLRNPKIKEVGAELTGLLGSFSACLSAQKHEAPEVRVGNSHDGAEEEAGVELSRVQADPTPFCYRDAVCSNEGNDDNIGLRGPQM